MKEKWVFEIPIYRCSIENYTKECDQAIQKHHKWLYEESGVSQSEAPRVYSLAEDRIRSEFGEWRYNQIIGWIRLLVMYRKMQGEYHFIKAKRIHKNLGNKKYLWQGKAFESFFDPDQSSEEIYRDILEEIERLKKEQPFKGRFLDVEMFHNVGPYIDWKTLINLRD